MLSALVATVTLAPQTSIPVDVKINLKKADVVFNVMNIVDAPARQNSLFLMQTLSDNLAKRRVPQRIVAVFHSQAAALVCGDAAYNRLTRTAAGNPYKAVFKALQKSKIQTEICVVSMEAQTIAKSDLLPGIKVNAGGLLRVIELTQKGYTQLTF